MRIILVILVNFIFTQALTDISFIGAKSLGSAGAVVSNPSDIESVFYNPSGLYDLKSKKRSRNISIPRQIAMYLCRTHTKLSLPEIGRQFGGKDHTTVIFANKKMSKLINTNNDLKKTVNIIIDNIESGKTLKNIIKKNE